MMTMRLLAIAIALSSCATVSSCKKKPAKAESSATASALQTAYAEKEATYLEEVPAENRGWPSITDCDGTVWAGTACLGGITTAIEQAEWEYGEIHRRPKSSGECYPNGAPSTVSRDQLVLYIGCAYSTGDVATLERVKTYADDHQLWMGHPPSPDYTLMTPTLMAILNRAIAKLGGKNGDGGAVIEAPGAKDYQDNIEAEEVLLSAAVDGGADTWELGLLSSLTLQFPKDALFQAAKGIYSGDCATASNLLLAPNVVVPSYVRGDQQKAFADAWWLRAATLVLSHCD